MGKKVKRFVGIAAAIAIPFAAPKIVAAIAGSNAFAGTAAAAALATKTGATLASAGVGAGLGAINAKLTDGDVGRGALFGGVGAGLSGYSAAADAIAAKTAAAGTTPSMLAVDPMTGAPLSQTTNVAGLSSAGGFPATSGVEGLNVDFIGSGGIPQQSFAQALSPVADLSNTAAAAGATDTGGSFTDAIKGAGREVYAKFSDPKVLADLTLRAGASLLTGQIAGDGLSREEQQLLQAQMQDLQTLRERDSEAFRTRMNEALGLIGEARYFDPEEFGLRAQARVQVAGAQQQREAQRAAALQPGGRGYSAADQRRAGLDITSKAQTAFLQGSDQAQRQRLATMQAGLSALPTGAPTASLNYGSTLMDMYSNADKRRRQEEQDIGSWFRGITGENTSTSDSNDTRIG
jgi:hypothetical protein